VYYCRFPLLFQGLGHVEFVVDVVALWHVSVECFLFSTVISPSTIFQNSSSFGSSKVD